MLALTGSGEYLPDMEAVDHWLLEQLPTTPLVVCLPTAAGTEPPQRIQYWMELAVQHFTRLGVSVEALEVTTRAHAHEHSFSEAVRAADFVYFSGGKPDYLYSCLEGTALWEAALGVHLRGGVLAGCSAGAMIMGERVLGFPRLSRGFGLLPRAVVLPHYEEFPTWMKRGAELLSGQDFTLVGIEGYTALVGDSRGWQVVGKGAVEVVQPGTLRRPGERRRFAAGESVPFSPAVF